MTKPTTPHRPHTSAVNVRNPQPRDWRCKRCFKLLGHRNEAGVHVRFARGHQYMMSTPVTAACRSCGTLNELRR